MASEQYLVGERYCSKSTSQIFKGLEALGQSFRFFSSDGFYGTERSLSAKSKRSQGDPWMELAPTSNLEKWGGGGTLSVSTFQNLCLKTVLKLFPF
jgi:hypothetical protein